jgi:hypothetical protein
MSVAATDSDSNLRIDTRQKTGFKSCIYGQMMTFNRIITGGITIIIGVLVYNQVFDALPSTTGAIDATAISSTVESAMLLAPVALIVLVSAVILGYVSGFGGGGPAR